MANPIYGSENFSTTLNVGGGINNSQTTGIILTGVSGLDTNGGILGFTWASSIDTSTYEELEYGSYTGNELTGVIRGVNGTSAKSHLNQAVIAAVVSKTHVNRLADKLTGRDATAVQDPNNNEIIKSDYVAAAVNEATVKNAATGNDPSIAATGGDTNIGLNIITKGSGVVKFNGVAAPTSVPTDGWTDDTARTWTYVSAQTFTVTGDQTAIFTKQTRLKFTQTTVKYAVVISSSFSGVTTVTIATNTDHTIANAAITANYYSYQVNPQGYPGWFNFTLANVVWDATAPTTVSATVARFSVVGLLCTVQIAVLYTNAGVGNAAFNCDGPIPAAKARASKYFYPASGYISDDGGGPASFPAVMSLYGTTPVFYINKSSGTVAAKYAAIFAQYEI